MRFVHFSIWFVGAAIGRPAVSIYFFTSAFGEFVPPYCTDERHPRVASLTLRVIHLLLAPTHKLQVIARNTISRQVKYAFFAVLADIGIHAGTQECGIVQ